MENDRLGSSNERGRVQLFSPDLLTKANWKQEMIVAKPAAGYWMFTCVTFKAC